MHKTRHAGFIYNHLGWHAAQLEKIYFLPVEFKHTGLWVGQTDKRQVVLLPVGCKSLCVFWTQYDDLCLAFDKFCIVLAQLRHMPLAEGSDKPAVKH